MNIQRIYRTQHLTSFQSAIESLFNNKTRENDRKLITYEYLLGNAYKKLIILY